MVQRVNSIDEIPLERCDHLDIYLSCEVQLAVAILADDLHCFINYNSDGRHPDFCWIEKRYTEEIIDGVRLSTVTGILIDASDITLLEYQSLRKKMEIIPVQSMLRIYIKEGRILEKLLQDIRAGFQGSLQHLCYVTPDFEFYCIQL